MQEKTNITNCFLVAFLVCSINRLVDRPRLIYQYSNMAPRFSGQNCNFLKLCFSIPERDLDTKKTTPNMGVCPETLES